MKELLQEMLFLDEKTKKFSTSKFMCLVSFYFILFINARALYLDKEIKNSAMLENTFFVTSGLYLGRRFSVKTKNGLEVGGEKDNEESKA